jgi:uncharacterized LabA/DUF88 family protein
MRKTIAYIDGFNLYHSIRALNKPHLKWLDLHKLSESLLRPHESLIEVNYFSAFATWIPDAHQRHIEYVKALEHVGVTCILGHFKTKRKCCRECGCKWDAHEEKETDVHIAARIVVDACENRFDRAILITADSDLVPAIDIVKSRFIEKEIFVAAPPKRMSAARGLKPKIEITQGRLAKALFPETAVGADGRVIFTRPASYGPPRPALKQPAPRKSVCSPAPARRR